MATRARPWWKDLPGGTASAHGRRTALAAFAIVAALGASLLSHLPAWRLLEARAFDHLSMIAPPPLPGDAPLIVAIDEPSLAELARQWPWPRDIHARLLTALRHAGARAVALDIVFAEPSEPAADAALAAAVGPETVLAAD